MANPKNDNPNSQPVPANVREEANIYEDEINLIDYFRVLWKRKYIILLGSVLPALIVGLIFFFWPRDYKVTYVYDVKDQSVYDVKDQSVYDVRDQSLYDVRDQSLYDVSNWNLNENSYKILLDRFYSEGNINKIVNKLQKNGLAKYAELISKAGKGEGLKKFVNFEVLPPYVDLSKVEVTDPTKLEQISQLKALLLKLTIIGRPKSDIPKISLVIRGNLESVIPVYFVEEYLNTAMQEYRTRMAGIEEARYTLDLQLERKKSTLEKLKNSGSGGSDKLTSGIVLQFDVGDNSAYLPLPYQIQAAETQIINLEEQIRADKEMYTYYVDLLNLNGKLFGYVKKVMPSYSTLEQFHSFLTETLAEYNENEQQLLDYLKAYIKRIENKVANVIPLVEKPKVYPVAKGTVKKSAIVFVIALMLSVFAAFLLEGLKKSQAQFS